jgi:formate dehydrogenase subunit beta
MTAQWMLKTRGDPLGTVRDFVTHVWQTAELTGMLVPTNGNIGETGPRFVERTEELANLNPFAPLMPLNAAKLVPELIEADGSARIGVMLRPCEMRTLIEMVKQNGFEIDELLTISVDCLGTLPVDEYQWRAERQEAIKGLTQEALQFSRQGGIVRYRYRSACQVCVSPQANDAKINMGILGLPVRQHMLISLEDKALAARLHIDELAEAPVDPELQQAHQRVTARLVQRSENTRERITNGLAELLPPNVEALIDQLESCGDCTTCLDECPLCDVHYPRRNGAGRFERSEIVRWLISCSGCGIQAAVCVNKPALNTYP